MPWFLPLTFSIYIFLNSWLKKIPLDYRTNTVDLSNVIASSGRAFVLGSHRCGLCGMKSGLKLKCAAGQCYAEGAKNKAYHFHVTCARQAGFQVSHDDANGFVGKFMAGVVLMHSC